MIFFIPKTCDYLKILITAIGVLVLVGCTVETQTNPNAVTEQLAPASTAAMEIATVVNNATPRQTLMPSETATTVLSSSETPTTVEKEVNTEVERATPPLVVSLAHINPDTYKLMDEYSLYLMNLDGEVMKHLIESDTDSFHANWSPDCKQIVFVGNSDYINEMYHSRLFVMSVEDNWSIEEIVTPLLAYRNPSWSPDGKSIVFEGVDGESTQVYVYTIDDQGLHKLTNEGNNYEPDWSPDGSYIVFTSDRNYEWTASSIYIMNIDGSKQKQLLPYFWGENPSSFENPGMYNPQKPIWSPDGKWIAFKVTENANDHEADKIYIMTDEGLNAHPIVAGDRYNDDVQSEDFYYMFEDNSRWSPDSEQILLTRSNGFTNETSLCIASVFSDEIICNPIAPQDIIKSVDWCSLSVDK